MSSALFGTLSRCAAALSAIALLVPAHALAFDSAPTKPRIDCTKPANKDKPACKPSHGQLSNDEIYNAAYWLSHSGHYSEALGLLAQAKDRDDPRLLGATGFATRKLGDVDGALPFYARALEINPNYVPVREYLGEAFLTKGDVANARTQLREIETRCGRTCTGYAELSRQIASFEVAHSNGS
jgi:tetratricopeptide (TPR) repeat protein